MVMFSLIDLLGTKVETVAEIGSDVGSWVVVGIRTEVAFAMDAPKLTLKMGRVVRSSPCPAPMHDEMLASSDLVEAVARVDADTYAETETETETATATETETETGLETSSGAANGTDIRRSADTGWGGIDGRDRVARRFAAFGLRAYVVIFILVLWSGSRAVWIRDAFQDSRGGTIRMGSARILHAGIGCVPRDKSFGLTS